MSLPVIFCDVDGVLNAGPTFGVSIDTDKAERLHLICSCVPANIVLTSNWRLSRSGIGPGSRFWMAMRASITGWNSLPYLIGATGDLSGGRRPANPGMVRAQEIQAYIAEHDVERFVVLDDLPIPGFAAFHVQTDSDVGLTAADAERAIDILRGRQVA